MGLRLMELRRAVEPNRSKFARMLGVNPKTYASWEKGENSISLEQAIACAKLLGCSLDELAGYESGGDFDARQAEMLAHYRSMNEDGRQLAASMVRTASRDPELQAKLV